MASKERVWTTEQRQAFQTVGTGLLVSAAAGSGKTSVLAERCAYLVCEAWPRCSVSQLLVVTFTEAAAAEMKSRIEGTLREKINEAGPEDGHLRRQLKLMEHANVSTLHGFCSRVLRQHFHRAGLDPSFAILDGDQGALMRVQVVREVFEERYDAGDEAFEAFVDAYGGGKDAGLMDLVVQTHELLGSVLEPAGWMQMARGRIAEGAERPMEESELGRELIGEMKEAIGELKERCGRNLAAMPGEFGKYADYLRGLGEMLREWSRAMEERGYDGLVEAVRGAEFGRMPTYKNDVPGKEGAQGLVTDVQGVMKGALRESLAFTAGEWRETLRVTLSYCETFLGLVREFSERYAAAKVEARVLDFGDLERKTLGLLWDSTKEGLVPTAVARGYHQQFAHVLVDEYQDINEVQDAILTLVSREGVADEETASNLFCVGDVKQSIYRFRLADPGRFLAKMEAYSGQGVGKKGKLIPLSANFRSRAKLLEVINGVFERLMTKATSEMDYDENHRLKPGAIFAEGGSLTGSPIELHLVNEAAGGEEETEESELDRAELEATWVAGRIEKMLAENVLVAEGGSYREIRARDIVILLRSPRFKAEGFAQALRDRGIAVHTDKGAGFFGAIEVQDVLSVLHLLDNRRQDIPMAAYLRGPLAGLARAEDALARVRMAYRGKMPFHEAVVRYAIEQDDELAAHLKDVLGKLDRWHELARQRPLAELVWTIYDETGYLAFCAGLEDGSQRVANLLHLHQRARQFGTFARQGLYRFLRFLESLQEATESATPSVSSESDDVVRIMSVHASKGLEFPVVFFADLGKRHNLSDSKRGILVDRKTGVGMQVMDEERQIRYPSLAHRAVKERIHQQAMAEELRLLYVAMTRAKEHLVLVGTCDVKKVETWGRKYGRGEGMSAQAFFEAGTFLDWIGPVAAMMGPGSFEVMVHERGEIEGMAREGQKKAALSEGQAKLARLETIVPEPVRTVEAERVIARLGKRYEFEKFTEVAAAMSVTGWTKHNKPVAVRQTDEEPIMKTFRMPLSVPKCMEEVEATAADRGSATHKALQYLHFSGQCDAGDFGAQLDHLVTRKLMAQAERNLVDVGSLVWLMGTEVGGILQENAKSLMREVPFYLSVEATRLDSQARSDDPADRVMVRGRIDVLVAGDGVLTLIDYKTDKVEPAGVPERAKSYAGQLDLYREALGKLDARKVAAKLVFLQARVVYDIGEK